MSLRVISSIVVDKGLHFSLVALGPELLSELDALDVFIICFLLSLICAN